MIFFRKKDKEEPKPKKVLQTVPHERVLTSEGWQRRTIKKTRKAKGSP